MAKKKYIDYKRQQQELFKRTEGYATEVRAIYLNSIGEIINLVKGTQLEDGKPFSFSDYGYSEEVTPILRSMYSRVYQEIRGGIQKEWLNANEHNDELVKGIFGEHSIEDKHFAKYFMRNKEAMDAFFARKTDGLDLSQKVWRYTGNLKVELEKSLDLAIGEGTAANRMATKIKEYLQEPDKFYRRFRVKIGEDEEGNPIYGRKWKRRIWSKEDNQYRWIDDNPKDYHPGKGVYRSSYKNAQRLVRTETNMAYRSADYERWQNFDFVVGVEIKLSNNHPVYDICDELKGVYPKGFKWTGWHPNCRCYMVPVLAKEEELDKMIDNILDGEDPGDVKSDNEVKELPNHFTNWMNDNQERVEAAKDKGTLPYFLRDNKKLVGLEKTTPLDVAKARHEARTKEDIERITKEWWTRKAIYHYGNNMLNVMGGIPDVDVTPLQEALKHADQSAILDEANKLKATGKEIYSMNLLDNPMEVAKKYGFADAKAVQNAVESKLQKWANDYGSSDYESLTDLDYKLKKLNYEIQWLQMNHHGKPWERTWEVSLNAYQKELLKVQDAKDWLTINNLAKTEFAYKTKSKIYQDNLLKLQDAIKAKDKNLANKYLFDAQAKRAELEKAAAKRVANKIGKNPFESNAYTDARRNAAMWAKSPQEADKVLRGQAETLWNSAAKVEKEAAHYYTSGSCYLNEPLRGIYYCGGKARDYATDMNALTQYIDKSPLLQDTWLQRGEGMGGFRGKFGFDLSGLSEKDAQKYVGKEGLEKAFLSCGNSKGAGFSGDIIYNLYCPKGTRGLYAEPFSYYGHGVNGISPGMNGSDGLLWDGKTMQKAFGGEAEVILQRGTRFRITKITRSGSTWFVDVDVIGQSY